MALWESKMLLREISLSRGGGWGGDGAVSRILWRELDVQEQPADMYLSFRLLVHCLKMLCLH